MEHTKMSNTAKLLKIIAANQQPPFSEWIYGNNIIIVLYWQSQSKQSCLYFSASWQQPLDFLWFVQYAAPPLSTPLQTLQHPGNPG